MAAQQEGTLLDLQLYLVMDVRVIGVGRPSVLRPRRDRRLPACVTWVSLLRSVRLVFKPGIITGCAPFN